MLLLEFLWVKQKLPEFRPENGAGIWAVDLKIEFHYGSNMLVNLYGHRYIEKNTWKMILVFKKNIQIYILMYSHSNVTF